MDVAECSLVMGLIRACVFIRDGRPREFYDILEDLIYFLCVLQVIPLCIFNLWSLLCVSLFYAFYVYSVFDLL